MRVFKNILVTGGYGFIGSNFIRYVFEKTDFEGIIVNMDKLTYAANPANIADLFEKYPQRLFFEKGDICNYQKTLDIFKSYNIDLVVHFAAESHVDRSITGPAEFIRTNINGTFNLLETARELWRGRQDVLFHHVSTDEVYGSLGDTGYFFEDTPYNPQSPYSASKAGSDHFVKAYLNTYRIPVTISNCSNNYGPYQFPEKLIPLILMNMMNNKPLPVYGNGKNVRDWLFVEDHCSGIWSIVQKGVIGETYNIGGESELQNIDLVNLLCERVAVKQGLSIDRYKNLITYVTDRPGHDMRYAINCDKIKHDLHWKRTVSILDGIDYTIDWYLNNKKWIEDINSRNG
ncbi:MAG TPA: dTDP-glucose 4,6-dehydratase [bacterium]|nr:dTDP-glucose 4,6-dehydratase [bacterium]